MKEWITNGDDLFVDLLIKIAQALGYTFEVNHLKRGIYTPLAQLELMNDQYKFRQTALELLDGKRSLKVDITKNNADSNMLN